MCTYFQSREHVARKTYYDDAFYELANDIREWWPLMTYAEKKSFAAANLRNGRITPGVKYEYQPQVHGGDFGVFRGSVEMVKICQRLNVYDDFDC